MKIAPHHSGTSEQPEVAMDTSEDGVGGPENSGDAEKDVLTWILGKLLDHYVNQTHPNVRQVCFSLLSTSRVRHGVFFFKYI